MTEAQTRLTLGDSALAALIGYEVQQTPGVVRLQPGAVRAARAALAHATRRTTARLGAATHRREARAVDRGAVEIEREPATGRVSASVQVVVSPRPTVLAVVTDVQRRVAAAVAVDLVVTVVDIAT